MNKSLAGKFLLGKAGWVAVLCLFGILGCRGVVSSDDDDDDGNGRVDGNISLWITDAPAQNVDRVEITITGVSFQRSDADDLEEILARPLTVDLLSLVEDTDMREEILDISLPAGDYDTLTLLLDETRLRIDVPAGQFDLTIPEEEKDGLVVPFNVNVDDDTELDLTIDFDVRKSLRNLGNNVYELHPVLRIERTDRTGNLEGTVDENLIRRTACDNGTNHREGNAVYIFTGESPFQDLRGDSDDPVSTAIVNLETSGSWEFTAPFLRQGSYNAVFTCDGSVDDPEEDNEIDMELSERVLFDITAGETTTIEFEEQ